MESTSIGPDPVIGLRSLQWQVTASPAQIPATCYARMRDAGLFVGLLETRHVRNAFKIMPVKTDRRD
jgi:hypothetical protein